MTSYENDRFREDSLRGRFEFKQTGTFSEYDIFGIVKSLVAFFIAVVTFLLFLFVFSRSFIINLLIIPITIVIILIWITCTKMFISGKEWKYIADNKKMVISRKGDVRIYKYGEVESVTYKTALRGFKSLSGYTVIVKCNNGKTHRYEYISPQNGALMAKENTPFYILNNPPKPFDKDADYYNGRF